MNWDKLTKMLQLAGAMLAVPAGIAGVYSVYRSHFSSDIACQALRTAIVTTMEKNIAAEAKRSLLRKDVAEFEKTCGAIDPDAKAIFTATLHQLEAPPPPPARRRQHRRPARRRRSSTDRSPWPLNCSPVRPPTAAVGSRSAAATPLRPS